MFITSLALISAKLHLRHERSNYRPLTVALVSAGIFQSFDDGIASSADGNYI